MSAVRGWAIVAALAAAWITSGAHAVVCSGDCDGDGQVRIDELVRGVGLALGDVPAESCDAFGAAPVRIESLISAAANSLAVCGPQGPYDGAPASLSFAGVVRNAPRLIAYPQSAMVSPDGAYVYVAGANGILVFARAAGDGRLTLVDDDGAARQAKGAGSATLSADGAQLYASIASWDPLAPELAVFARDAASGRLLAASQTVGNTPSPVPRPPTGRSINVRGRHRLVARRSSAAAPQRRNVRGEQRLRLRRLRPRPIRRRRRRSRRTDRFVRLL